MSKEFQTKVAEYAKTAVTRANRVTSEEAAKQYLVLPFFQFLGYDPLNPDEIIPESQASFSDKFKNRVDYAICHDGNAVIAVECKRTGALTESHRGELKGYFNAVPTTKLGILTDGLMFELYSDTNAENMMDDEPYVTIDLAAIASGDIDENSLDALSRLRKGTFDPQNVGAEAKRKIFIARYIEVLDALMKEPTEEFTRFLLDAAKVEGRRTARLIEEHQPIVRDSISLLVDKIILDRVGFAQREDLVRVSASGPQPTPPAPEPTPATDEPDGDGIITTDTEMRIFQHALTRLSFLVKDDAHYRELSNLEWRDFKTTFIVYYKQARRGRLFTFREGPNGELRFEFSPDGKQIETTDLYSVDEHLLASYLAALEAAK
ncbi:MAG: type I restriction enzyme HsdR N-terminal domain-containing protein [Trueperaceae bacterium]|nr:type I restriction enzyme HsdR N-terminal domain-containing protein [Trueperaceae bacterium]